MENLPSGAGDRIAAAIMELVTAIPATTEGKNTDPGQRSAALVNGAARKAAALAGALALPPGLLGWVTVLPDLIGVWKIQGQMIADIAACYGRKSRLTRETMLFCLFKHAAAQVVRDLVVRVGERYLIRRASLRVLQAVAARLGITLTQRVIGKSLSRWIPILGAGAVAAYAYWDTREVGNTAIELFSSEIQR